MLDKSSCETKSTARDSSDLLLVDKTSISLTLLSSQSARETIAFTNPTASPIRMRFDECPFRIQSDKLLGFVLAGQL